MELSPYEWSKYFDLIDEGIAFVGRDYNFIRTNPAMSEITGYSKYELEQRTLDSITHPDDIKSSRMAYEQLIRGEIDNYSLVKRYISKTGESIWVRKFVYPIKKDGKVEHLFVQAIRIKNGAREQLKKVNDKIEVVEYISVGRFFQKYWINIVSFIGMVIITFCGWLLNYVVTNRVNNEKVDIQEKRIERLENERQKDLPGMQNSSRR